MHRVAALSGSGIPALGLAVFVVFGLVAPAAVVAQSADLLPACEWCGTAEAPAELGPRVTIAEESEPGERLVIRGTVFEPDGATPASGVLLYLYHTNVDGIYPKRGDETGNARRHGYLRGWLRTDGRGAYAIETILPGNYPGRDAAAHIHVTVQESDGTPEYWLPSFKFADDPHLDEDPDSPNVLELERRDGAWHGRRDIVLPSEPPR